MRRCKLIAPCCNKIYTCRICHDDDVLNDSHKLDRFNVKEIILNQPETTHDNLAEQFRILKQNFNVTGQYNDEDLAYIEFKRHESKALLIRRSKKKKINKYWSYPSYWFQHLIFDLAGQYATNPLRVLFSM